MLVLKLAIGLIILIAPIIIFTAVNSQPAQHKAPSLIYKRGRFYIIHFKIFISLIRSYKLNYIIIITIFIFNQLLTFTVIIFIITLNNITKYLL